MKRLIHLLPLISLALLPAGGVKAFDSDSDSTKQRIQLERLELTNSSSQGIANSIQVVQQSIPQESFVAANQLKITAKQIAPYAQETDLQIVCLFKHKSSGDTLLSAAAELDQQLGGLISSLRNRGEFVGDELETFLLIPPQNTIKPKRLLLIGLGDEKNLSLDVMQRVGTVALREAIKLKATHVSFAPILRDQGNSELDAGDVAQAVIQNVILAYDTEKRLQQQGLAQPFTIQEWVSEAGSLYYKGVVQKIQQAIELSNAKVSARSSTLYVNSK
jgi:Cytosol aminopeptidase family, N-terminal domain